MHLFWCPNDEAVFFLCSNHGYSDSLPLRAEWRPLLFVVVHSHSESFSNPAFAFSHQQIFVGKIPRDLFEDELVPLFERAGPIWDLRLMMDPLSGLNRGYAFVTFCTKEAAQQAVKLVGGPDRPSNLRSFCC